MDAEAEEGDADASDAKRKEKQEEEVRGLAGVKGLWSHPCHTYRKLACHISHTFIILLEPIRNLEANLACPAHFSVGKIKLTGRELGRGHPRAALWLYTESYSGT